jgi:hypothetical protein
MFQALLIPFVLIIACAAPSMLSILVVYTMLQSIVCVAPLIPVMIIACAAPMLASFHAFYPPHVADHRLRCAVNARLGLLSALHLWSYYHPVRQDSFSLIPYSRNSVSCCSLFALSRPCLFGCLSTFHTCSQQSHPASLHVPGDKYNHLPHHCLHRRYFLSVLKPASILPHYCYTPSPTPCSKLS